MSAEDQASQPAEDITTTPPGASPQVETGETLKLASDDIIKRRSRWQSSVAALRYIYSVSRDNEVKVRDSDKSTAIALLICCGITLLTLLVPGLASQRLPFVFICDVLIGAALLFYVANRFGIVTTLTPRQAYLTWQLMLGASLLGIFMAMNLSIIIGYVISQTHIDVLP